LHPLHRKPVARLLARDFIYFSPDVVAAHADAIIRLILGQ